MTTIALFANTDWYLYNFRRQFACDLRAAGYRVVMISPPGPYGARLAMLGFNWQPLPLMRRSLNPLREAVLVARLALLLRSHGVDLVHGFTIKPAVYCALASRLVGGIASISAIAGMGYVFSSEGFRTRALRALLGRLFRAAFAGPRARVILQNPDDRETLLADGLADAKNIRVILGSGVDCRLFHPHVGERRPGPLRVLLASRLIREKGIAEFADAARQLAEEGRRIEFLLAGEPDPGNPAAIPVAMLEEWRAAGLVTLLGHVEDMPSLMREVDVVTLPSYYREGVPRCLIEAAASGCALITTDMPGCREVVSPHGEGLLVPPQDAMSLAQAIAQLDDDPKLRARFGEAARAKALACFDVEIVNRSTLAVYDELLGCKAQACRDHGLEFGGRLVDRGG